MSIGLGLAIAVLILVIAVFIARSVRTVLFDIDKQLKGVPRSQREEAMRSMIERLQSLDVRCPRCGETTFLVLGTRDGYKCERCAHQFTGPPHPTLTDG
jgi:transposase-like protein